MLMSLGLFVFGLDTLAFDTLRRQTAWRHPSNSRVGARPARQFIGQGDDTITLSGILAPEFKGTALSLDSLREMADSGKAWAMVSGAGDVFGAWVIENMTETGTIFIAQGRPRRIEFELQLARTDDSHAEGSGGVDPWPDDDYWEWWM
jgi:phage protein U